MLFVPRRPGQDWDEALDAAEARDAVEEPLGAERLAQCERVLRRLRERAGDVAVTTAEDTAEAVHASGLQVCLFPHEAAVSFPVRERADAEAFHDLVVDVVGIVEQETALQAYDAQSAATFDGDLHLEGLEPDEPEPAERDPEPEPATTPSGAPGDALTSGGPGTPTDDTASGTTSAAAEDPAARAAAQVATLRRTALRYTGLGAVILAVGLLLRSSGSTGFLVDVTLLLGAFDLAIGGVSWLQYRRRRDALAAQGAGTGLPPAVAPGPAGGAHDLDEDRDAHGRDDHDGDGHDRDDEDGEGRAGDGRAAP